MVTLMENETLSVRRELLSQAHQVVIKAGTRLLTSQEAIAELARILGGAKITDAVYETAQEMKELAVKMKKSE